jgi:hypothetical protein
MLLLCAIGFGAGCAVQRADTSPRIAGAIYVPTGRAVWLRAEDVARAYCVDGQALICEASDGRLDERRCSCPGASRRGGRGDPRR